MKFTCADCGTKACEQMNYDKMPDASVCISKNIDQQWFKDKYNEEDIEIAHNAAVTEAAGYCRQTRLEETMAFAYRMGYHKLGIAFCTGLSKEAATLAGVLRDNGFEVEAACCKCGAIPKSFVGVAQEEQLHPERDFEIMCNPAGQAAFLDAAGVDLALVLGLCVGHDTIFLRQIKAPVTYVAVKDRATGHNPLAAIYCANGYLRRVFSFVKTHWPSKP